MSARFPLAGRGARSACCSARGPRPLMGAPPPRKRPTFAAHANADAPSPPPAAAAAAAAPPLAADPDEAALWGKEQARYDKFRAAYQAAQTMSQLYNVDRPPPVPLQDFEVRRLERETQEVCAAARRLSPADAGGDGGGDARTREALAQLDSLVPGLLDLSAMTAREFALLASDVRGAAARILALRVAWPRADVGRVVRRRPRMLLPPDAAAVLKRLARGQPAASAAAAAASPAAAPGGGGGGGDGAEMAAASVVARDAAAVRRALEGGADPRARRAVALAAERGGHASVDAAVDAVVEAAPELMDRAELSRALAFVRASFPSSREHPAALLAENPRLLLNLGESDMDDNADYGDITTRD